ncbi:hypothetical protein [Nocardiopsis sp. NPDC006938]|uniref:hypothetical protein n=1 Tax=Nocardiopsis sp. NPDC006938 TaxID=3364337 RepID=UPI0036B29664
MSDYQNDSEIAREALAAFLLVREHAGMMAVPPVAGGGQEAAPWRHPGVCQATDAYTSWVALAQVARADVVAAWWWWADVVRRTAPGAVTVVDALSGARVPGDGWTHPEGDPAAQADHERARRYLYALGLLAQETGAWESVSPTGDRAPGLGGEEMDDLRSALSMEFGRAAEDLSVVFLSHLVAQVSEEVRDHAQAWSWSEVRDVVCAEAARLLGVEEEPADGDRAAQVVAAHASWLAQR